MNDFGEILIDLRTTCSILNKEFQYEKCDIFYLKTSAETLLTLALDYRDKKDEYIDRFDLKELNSIISDIKQLIKAVEKEIEIQNKEEYFNSNNNEI